MQRDDPDEAQRERATQAWELRVDAEPDPALLKTLRRVLRVKRFELPALAGRLPGVVRRGARVDLAPLHQALVEARVPCELRRRTLDGASGPAGADSSQRG